MIRGKLLLVLVFIIGITALPYEGCAATRSNLNEKIHELTEKLTATTTGEVIDVDNGTVYINLGEKDSIYPGSLFEVVKLGTAVILHKKPYYKEKTVGIIEVTRVRGDYSLAKIVAKAGPITKNCRVYQITSLSPSKLTISLPAEKTVQQVIAVPGVDIKSVYRRLDKAGFSPGPFSTKHLGQLSAAIKRFQKMAHLSETGVVDSSTWEKMRKLFDPGEGDLPLTEAPEGGNTAAAPEIEKTVRSGKPCKIVLMEFNYDNSYNNLTKNIYESLSVALIQKGFQVVERSKLDQVLKEQKLATTGLIDLSTAQKIGQLAGGNVVLVGTVSDMGNLVAIRARMVDVEKGVALTAAEVTMDKTPDIAAALEQDVTEKQANTGSIAGKKKKQKHAKLPSFKNDLLTIQPISMTRQGDEIILKLKYINTTKDAIKGEFFRPRKNTYLVDEIGNQYAFKSGELSSYEEFPPGVPRIITIVFRISSKPLGSTFTLASKHYLITFGTDFFVTIKGLKID